MQIGSSYLQILCVFFFFCLVGWVFFETEFRSFALVGVSGTKLPHCNLCPSGSRDSPASASQVAGMTGIHHHTWLIFVFLVEMGFRHVGQAGVELLTSGDPPASASQSAGITGISHQARPQIFIHLPVINFITGSN